MSFENGPTWTASAFVISSKNTIDGVVVLPPAGALGIGVACGSVFYSCGFKNTGVKEGLLIQSRGKITVQDQERLEEIAEFGEDE
jgi:hypothetical protein